MSEDPGKLAHEIANANISNAAELLIFCQKAKKFSLIMMTYLEFVQEYMYRSLKALPAEKYGREDGNGGVVDKTIVWAKAKWVSMRIGLMIEAIETFGKMAMKLMEAYNSQFGISSAAVAEAKKAIPQKTFDPEAV